jgi:hypothetical protein
MCDACRQCHVEWHRHWYLFHEQWHGHVSDPKLVPPGTQHVWCLCVKAVVWYESQLRLNCLKRSIACDVVSALLRRRMKPNLYSAPWPRANHYPLPWQTLQHVLLRCLWHSKRSLYVTVTLNSLRVVFTAVFGVGMSCVTLFCSSIPTIVSIWSDGVFFVSAEQHNPEKRGQLEHCNSLCGTVSSVCSRAIVHHAIDCLRPAQS